MNRRHLLANLALLPIVPFASGPAVAAPSLEKIAGGLDYPWGLAFLPDGSALVTERSGRLRHVTLEAGSMLSDPISGVPSVDADEQGGLLDVALSPGFNSDRTIFLSFSETRDGGNCTSVARAVIDPAFRALSDVKTIFRQNTVHSGGRHFGSRLVFDRSGHLFVTTGDRFSLRDLAQDPAKHVGKILRITVDGAAAPDNPKLAGWAPEVWSIGHRNVQGAALHPETGQLWTAEHGARGGDEINTPMPGRNYGWPVITYGRDYSGLKIGEGIEKAGMEQPVKYWDPSIAPAGVTFYTGSRYAGWQGNLFVCALAGQHVARLTVEGGRIAGEERLFDGVARFRDIAEGPDGYLYVITDEGDPDGGVFRVVA